MNHRQAQKIWIITKNSEVSRIDWLSYDECIKMIRPYNLEKKKFLKKLILFYKNIDYIHNI